jgi:hypothetical protein
MLKPERLLLKIGWSDLAGAVAPQTQFVNAIMVDIETDDRGPGARKGHGDRKTHIT